MNLFSPSETSDILDCIIAAWGAPFVVCGSCCDWDCCGALGWSWARTDTTGARRSPTNTEVASLLVIRLDVEVCCPQTAGRMVVGQALRLLVAAALRAAFECTGRSDRKTRFAQRSGYSLIV